MPTTDWIVPQWDAPPRVRAVITTRQGGHSIGPYASMNLGEHVGDDPNTVARNHALLAAHLPRAPLWLKQVHGTRVIDTSAWHPGVQADAAHTNAVGVVCAVMVADCIPVLFSDQAGERIAAAHAGWRGLCGGVLEYTVAAMGAAPSTLRAYLGPAIGARAFEVGEDVYQAFTELDPQTAQAFTVQSAGKWLCDLFALARARLARAGVGHVFGGQYCTYSDRERFFSHRRERPTGRMAALIWLDPSTPA